MIELENVSTYECDTTMWHHDVCVYVQVYKCVACTTAYMYTCVVTYVHIQKVPMPRSNWLSIKLSVWIHTNVYTYVYILNVRTTYMCTARPKNPNGEIYGKGDDGNYEHSKLKYPRSTNIDPREAQSRRGVFVLIWWFDFRHWHFCVKINPFGTTVIHLVQSSAITVREQRFVS